MLPCIAHRPVSSVAAVDLLRLGPCHLLRTPEAEQLRIKAARGTIMLTIAKGTAIAGPVVPEFRLGDLSRLAAQVRTLRRFEALRTGGHLPHDLAFRDGRIRRWILMLRILDARAQRVSQRQVAERLFGEAAVRSGWSATSDYLRSQVRRLEREGRALVAGGYRRLLAEAG